MEVTHYKSQPGKAQHCHGNVYRQGDSGYQPSAPHHAIVGIGNVTDETMRVEPRQFVPQVLPCHAPERGESGSCDVGDRGGVKLALRMQRDQGQPSPEILP